MNNFVNGTSYEFIPNTEKTTGTFTPASGVTVTYVHVYQNGAVCYLNIDVTGSFSGSKKLGTISNMGLPESDVFNRGVGVLQDYSTDNDILVNINASGEIYASFNGNTRSIQFSLMYMA